MRPALRRLILAVAGAQAVLAVLIVARVPWVVGWWPFPGTTELTFVFVGAFLAAAASSALWCVLFGETASLAGMALDYMCMLVPLAVYLLLLDPSLGGGLTAISAGVVASAAFGVWLFSATVRAPVLDRRPMPRGVRVGFAVFVVALVLVGGSILLGVPDVLPWQVTRELAVLAGLLFAGAASYFAYGLARPSWANAGGQLAGFLAYDLVLVVPLLARLSSVTDLFRAGLWGYVAVVVGSGALAIWYLFVDPRTRLGASAEE